MTRLFWSDNLLPVILVGIFSAANFVSSARLTAAETAAETADTPAGQTEQKETPTDDKTSEPKEPDAEPDAEPVKVEGVFQAKRSWELVHEADQIESLEIERILPHGTRVSKEQTVVWFVSDPIDRQVAAAEVDLKLAQLAAEDDQFDYEQFLQTQTLDREAATRTRAQARQAYDNYVKIDREQQIETANFDTKNAQASLDNVMEELTQLTQMYEADGLTEESEEIVLKRAKQSVESAQFRLRVSQVRTDRTVKQSIPQQDASQESTLARAEMAYEKSIRDLDSAKKQRDLKRQKSKAELAKKEADFEKLKSQRKSVVMKSPGEGILLHGELTRGALPAKNPALEAGAKTTKSQVIATVVATGPMHLRVEFTEAQIAKIQPGDACVVRPAAKPEQTVDAVVKSIGEIGFAAGKFDGLIEWKDKLPDAVVPTMTGSAEFKP